MGSSTFYLFSKEKLIHKVPIWPQEELEHFKEKFKGREKDPRLKNAMFDMFNNWYLDQDTQRHFYLLPPGHRDLLQFDLEGKLVGRFSKPWKTMLWAKSNNRFYGVYDDRIIILEEKKNEN